MSDFFKKPKMATEEKNEIEAALTQQTSVLIDKTASLLGTIGQTMLVLNSTHEQKLDPRTIAERKEMTSKVQSTAAGVRQLQEDLNTLSLQEHLVITPR